MGIYIIAKQTADNATKETKTDREVCPPKRGGGERGVGKKRGRKEREPKEG